MTSMRHVRARVATVALVGTLAGCGGVATIPSSALSPAMSQMQLAGAPIADEKCPIDKGVSLKPCAVKLMAARPDVVVTTKGPAGGKFTVSDTGCETRMIATIKGSANAYKITAGTHGKGECVATFIDYDSAHKRLGAAKEIIVNGVDKRNK